MSVPRQIADRLSTPMSMVWRACLTRGCPYVQGQNPVVRRALSTLGTFLRGFTIGHLRQRDGVAVGLLQNRAAHTLLLPAPTRSAGATRCNRPRAAYIGRA
jgi:hypothetical protein